MKKLFRGANLTIVVFVVLSLAGGPPLFAQALEQITGSQYVDSQQIASPTADVAGISQQSSDSPDQSQQIDESKLVFEQKAIKRLQFLEHVRNELRASQRDFYDSTKNTKDVGDRLSEIQTQVTTLREQLLNLDQQIANTENMINNVMAQIGEKENQLLLLYNDIELKKAAIENQKRMLLEYLEVLYEQENSMIDTLSNGQDISIVKLLLADESVGEHLLQIKYFNILEEAGHEIFEQLEKLLVGLRVDEEQLEKSKARLAALYERLEEEKGTFDVQRAAKGALLEQTKGEEKIYRQLYEESQRQQDQMQEDIKVLRDNINFIKEKMAELGPNFNPEDYRMLLGGETISVYEYINATKDKVDGFTMRWPVSPSRGISAYFRDESYRRVFGVGHNAIDIRIPQGTLVRAPADGVVYKVRDNGYGYSYLILAHEGGFMTVYGHVQEFRVEPGDKVQARQIVAMSGGTPGTKGAGLMTTGAHLHFEVMQGGRYVDPLDYLSLSFLPLDTLPDKYSKRATGDATKVKRVSTQDEAVRNDDELTRMIELNGRLEEFTNSSLSEVTTP